MLEGPGVKARGVSFAGTQLVVQLGRGVDYAWSATSASNDNVDTVVERLCSTDGSPVTVRSTAYRVDGKCVPMDRHVHEETALPNLGATEPPRQIRLEVLRTRHGIVQLRTTVRGRPVAIVTQRSTYHHEVDSVVGFARLNDPAQTHDAASFQRSASAIDYTFNWFYTDSRDISYYSSGLLPRRAKGTDFDLPRWGDRRYDWKGWLPFGRHVHQTNPPPVSSRAGTTSRRRAGPRPTTCGATARSTAARRSATAQGQPPPVARRCRARSWSGWSPTRPPSTRAPGTPCRCC